jgi:ketosteroid isomerase-like protein
MTLYAQDGVFMPPYSQSAVGSSAVRKAYDAVFKAIALNVKFTIHRWRALKPPFVYKRTHSNLSGLSGPTGTRALYATRPALRYQVR